MAYWRDINPKPNTNITQRTKIGEYGISDNIHKFPPSKKEEPLEEEKPSNPSIITPKSPNSTD